MNENLNLEEILKDCPKGTKLYSTILGEVKLYKVKDNNTYPIGIEDKEGVQSWLTSNGKFMERFDGECILFPSREQRDWSKFKVKKPKFDTKTLRPFDKVLVRDCENDMWKVDFYSHKDADGEFTYVCIGSPYTYCIPYNDDTKYLVGTIDEEPEYYRYCKE